MKKALTLVAAALSTCLVAQNSFQLLNYDDNNNVIPANSAIYAQVNADDTHKANIDIQNTSSTAQTYGVRRFDVVLNSSGGFDAEAFFCFGGDCYTPGVMDSQNPITLQPNEKSSELAGSFQMLLAELTEVSVVGLSHVKYTFYNVNNSSDTIQFSLRYNDPFVGLRHAEITRAAMTLAPNPARGSAQALVSLPAAGKYKVSIYNALGALVNNTEISLAAGTHSVQLNIDELKKGIYFVSLSGESQAAVQRLIID